jgi:hypothetical protein
MTVIREVTNWPDNTPNHDYVLNEAGKLIAYRKLGVGDWITVDKPMMFSKSHRRFQKLKEKFIG